jgi:hypothetical protein
MSNHKKLAIMIPDDGRPPSEQSEDILNIEDDLVNSYQPGRYLNSVRPSSSSSKRICYDL